MSEDREVRSEAVTSEHYHRQQCHVLLTYHIWYLIQYNMHVGEMLAWWMSRSQLQCNEASGFSLIKLVSVYECVPIQNQSVFSFIQYLKVVRHKLCIKVMITMPTQTLAVIQLPRHKPLTSTTPRSWAVYLSSSIQGHWQSSWHLVTWPVFETWMVDDETSYMNVHSAALI